MITLGDNLVAKSGTKEFYCGKCDYKCSKKYNWDKHLLTAKHNNDDNGDKLVAKSGKKWQQEAFKCEYCDKEYQHRQNLWRHNKNCSKNNESSNKDDLILKILKQNSDLIKENSELRKEHTDIKEIILEIVKNGITNTNNSHNTITNSHNKAFNLNFFLNETCKNAMNITDFVDSIKLQLSDLIEVGELGYVEGISKIIVKNLNNLDETVRPVHCTDKKRETMYVKDEGEWIKEDEKKSKLTRAVKTVADKNIRLLPQFREKYPEYKNSSSRISDKYDKLVIEVMTTDEDKNEKIIKNISKATVIKEK
jgi:gas vesicle protein